MIRPDWTECIVAATGPSLTAEVAEKCRGSRVIAVNDAWQWIPFADVLYACDARFWDIKGCGDFQGERWSSTETRRDRDKVSSGCAERHGLCLIRGQEAEGFSFEPGLIHYGSNSGFQAVNLALQFGAKLVRLAGFDMKPNGHCFGKQIDEFTSPDESSFRTFRRAFEVAAKSLPDDIRIINCTPGSALTCFPMGEL